MSATDPQSLADTLGEALRVAAEARATRIIEEQAALQNLTLGEDELAMIGIGVAAGIAAAVAELRDLGLIYRQASS